MTSFDSVGHMVAQAEIYADADLKPGKEYFHKEFLRREGLAHDGVNIIAAWRIVDPQGEVGMELFLAELSGVERLVQIPLTYRPQPLSNDAGLLGTMQHSELGQRWIYDARQDPTFHTALNRTFENEEPAASQKIMGSGDNKPPQVELRSVRGDEHLRGEGDLHAEIQLVIEQDFTDEPGTLQGAWGAGEKRRIAVLARRVTD